MDRLVKTYDVHNQRVNLSDKVGNIKPRIVVLVEKYQKNGEEFMAGRREVSGKLKDAKAGNAAAFESYELTWKSGQKRPVVNCRTPMSQTPS